MKSLQLKSLLLSLLCIGFFSFFITSCDKSQELLEEKEIVESNEVYSRTTYQLPERLNNKSDAEILAYVDQLSKEELSKLSVEHEVEKNDARFDIVIFHFDCVTATDWVLLNSQVVPYAACPGGSADISNYKMVCLDKDGNTITYFMTVTTCIPAPGGGGGPGGPVGPGGL